MFDIFRYALHPSLQPLPGCKAPGLMSAYKDALAVDADSSEEHLALAGEILDTGSGIVLFQKTVALQTAHAHLYCEVVDPVPAARRCENEFEVLVENAQRILESSRIQQYLPDIPRKWLVVEDNGTGTVVLWRAHGHIA